MGFSSLFDYAVRELGYSEGAAYRRIKAMKLCCDFPETESRLQSGRLSLSAACQLQTFFEKQTKKANASEKSESESQRASDIQKLSQKKPSEEIFNGKTESLESALKADQNLHGNIEAFPEKSERTDKTQPLSEKEKQHLITRVEGCSTRATKKLLSEVDPGVANYREQTRFLGGEKWK